MLVDVSLLICHDSEKLHVGSVFVLTAGPGRFEVGCVVVSGGGGGVRSEM